MVVRQIDTVVSEVQIEAYYAKINSIFKILLVGKLRYINLVKENPNSKIKSKFSSLPKDRKELEQLAVQFKSYAF